MATYTVRISEWVHSLREDIIAEHPDQKLTYSQIVDLASQKIINFSYTAYGTTPEEDQMFRKELNVAIVRANLMKEIGYETPELWLIQLETRLRMIMPRYRELYKSTLFELEFENPFHLITSHNEKQNDNRKIDREGGRDTNTNSEMSTTYGRTTVDSGKGNRDIDTDVLAYDSDFPQASFAHGDYATSGNTSNTTTHESSDTNNTTTNSGTDKNVGKGLEKETWSDGEKNINQMINEYIHDVKGHTNNMDILLAVEKWRELIININEMIVGELADLFMMVYN